MTLRNVPLFASTAFSVVLHLALVLALLQLPAMPLPGGNELRIELQRALAAPGQTDTAMLEQNTQPSEKPVAEQAQPVDESLKTQSVANDPAPSVTKAQARPAVASGGDRANGADTHTAATDAEPRTAAMLELLHNEISDHKRYPYLARRQHREGTARVGFVLQPDGRIDNTALLESSRSPALDHAALSAVEEISPFEPASEYLTQAQTFSVDVVFNLR
jgi:periplasmic protein TonB